MGDGILELAARQHGLLSRPQAVAAGLSEHQIHRRVSEGHWERVLPHVYRVHGAARTWLGGLQAATLWAGANGALSHGAAAAWWGFSRFESAPPELTLLDRRKPPPRVKSHSAAAFAPGELVLLRGLRVTSRLRTLLDLAGTCDPLTTRACVDEAMRRRWTTAEQLSRLVERSAHTRGVELLRSLVREYEGGDGPTESELELRVYELLDSEGLPRPMKQRPVMAGGRLRRLDFFFPSTPIVLEADGFAWHATLDAFERERARHNALTMKGLVVIRWTWRAISDEPEKCAAQLRALLSLYGWR